MNYDGLKELHRAITRGPEPDIKRVYDQTLATAGGAVGTPQPSPRREPPNVYQGKTPEAPADWGIEGGAGDTADDEGRETFRRF